MQFGFEKLSSFLVLALSEWINVACSMRLMLYHHHVSSCLPLVYLSPSYASETNNPSGVTITYIGPVIAGSRTNFTCSSTCIPQCTYTWVLKGGPVQGPTLSWIPDGLDSQVNLQCTAVNPASGRSETSTVTVEVENPFSVQLGSGFIFPTLNKNFTLRCNGAEKTHEVAWFKDGQALTPDPRIQMLAGNSTLHFTSLLSSDGGFYQCTTSRQKEKAVFSLVYLLNFEPWTVSISGPDTVQPDRETTFFCLVNCTVKVDCSISWRFRGTVPSGSLSIRGRILRWNPFTPLMFQNLTCVVENPGAGRSAEAFKMVKVLDRPVDPIIPVSESDVVMLCTMLLLGCCLGLPFLFGP